MADANWLRKTPPAPATSIDDPFAELTKIMGFDPRVPFRGVQQPQPSPAQHQVAAPTVDFSEDDFDLSIDLERELMGALEPELADAGVAASAHAPQNDYRSAPQQDFRESVELPLDQQAYDNWPSEQQDSDADATPSAEYDYSAQSYRAEQPVAAEDQPGQNAYFAEQSAPESAYERETPYYAPQQGASAYEESGDSENDADLVAHLDEELVSSFESELQLEEETWSEEDERAYQAQALNDGLAAVAEPRETDEFAHDFDEVMAEVDMDFTAAPVVAQPAYPVQESALADSDAGFADDLSTALADELDFDLADEAQPAGVAHSPEASAYSGFEGEEEAFDAPYAEQDVAPTYDYDAEMRDSGIFAAPVEDEAPSENSVAQSEIDDAIAELAAMVRGYDRTQAVPVAQPAEAAFRPLISVAPAEDAPDIETIDVPEGAVALADDLDVPELEYAEDVSQHFDDLDAELAAAFGEPAIEVAQPVQAESRADAPDFDLEEGYDATERRSPSFDAAPFAMAGGAAHYTQQRTAGDFQMTRRSHVASQDDYDFQVDPDLEDELAFAEEMEAVQKPSPRRGLIIASVVGGIAVLGAIGAYAFSGGDGTVSGEPALVKADIDPVKVRPENPGGLVVANQDSRVFDRTAGATSGQPDQQKLVSNEEEPVDLAARFPDAIPQPIDESADLNELADGAPKDEDRIDQAIAADEGQPASGETVAVAPRKVRTMVVKSDGTLVPREEVIVEPETVGSTTAAGSLTDPAVSQLQTGGTEPIAAQPVEAAAAPARSNTPASVPVAPSRPAEQPLDIVGEVKPEKVASIDPATIAPAAGTWSMQIASQPSEAAAQSSYRDLARRYAGVLGGRQASIVKADIAGKGTFWRVRVPAETRNDAIKLCESYKAAGGNCFVSK